MVYMKTFGANKNKDTIQGKAASQLRVLRRRKGRRRAAFIRRPVPVARPRSASLASAARSI
eukprot:8998977-Alexandrium_andersonii.AAC.1